MSFITQQILTNCFGIENYEIEKVFEEGERIIFELKRTCACFCGKCGCIGGKYDFSIQEILIGTLNLKPLYARLKVYRIKCPMCCKVTTERHGISEGKKRYSKAVEKTTVYYTEKLDNASTAKLFGVSEMSVYRMDFSGLSKLENQYLKNLPKPSCLTVDEASYKRMHNYATIISSYKDGKVLWAEQGRKQSDLARGYNQLEPALADVKAVSMDLWRAYESATKTKLPSADIIYDRFHIARLINRAIEKERRLYQKTLADKDRKIMKKHSRWILLKRNVNLTEKNKDHLAQLKKVNKTLYDIYLMKECFLSIFDQFLPIKLVRKQMFNWIRDMLKTDFEYLKRFARSILKRMRSILHWFKNPISNGKAEGINNVIKTLLKRAYGYKNFDYLRMKILQKCGYLMNYVNHSFC
jgi:transposase